MAHPDEENANRERSTWLAAYATEADRTVERLERYLLNAEHDGTRVGDLKTHAADLANVCVGAEELGLEDLADLASAFELLLEACGRGTPPLTGGVADLAFDAAGGLRRALARIRTAGELGRSPGAQDGLNALTDALRVAAEGDAPPEKDLPSTRPGQRLGDILVADPFHVPHELVERAAEEQQRSGRRLGEEVVAQQVAPAAVVARALRAQLRASGRQPTAGIAAPREPVKVDPDRLERLAEVIGELVVAESMMALVPELCGARSQRARVCLAQLAKVTRDLQDSGMRLRMVQVEPVFQKMSRLVRDLSRRSGRAVRVLVDGAWTEVDRFMAEKMADPLVHLVRNVLDHGLEDPAARTAAGKPAAGTIRLSARQESGNVILEVADDGRGLDRARIAAKAVERGLLTSADGLSDEQVNALIFEPGFSTMAQGESTGRGVGMDVVRRNVEALRGRIHVTSTPGQGTTVRLVLPLTLAIVDGMLVACGEERFVIPTLSIVESLRPGAGMVVTVAGRSELLHLRGDVLPLLRLGAVLGMPGARAEVEQALVVVLELGKRRFGLLVDDVLRQQQVVIKGVGDGLPDASRFAGAAILEDGRVGLILSVESLAAELDGAPAA